jgi:predicted ribosomally synthesized peptide with nif11-like leader
MVSRLVFGISFPNWKISIMSKANARAFLKKLMSSKELVARCQAAREEERLRIAAALGLPHTADDMQAVIDEGISRAKRRIGELSEQELEHLSGGQGAVIVVPVVVLQLLSANVTPDDPLELDLDH